MIDLDFSMLLGVALGLVIGFICRWFDLPLPAPPKLVGAILVVFMTFGFIAGNTFKAML